MAENRPVCVLCNRTVINRRRFEIARGLFEANAGIAQYIIDAIAPQHVSILIIILCLDENIK